MNIIYRNYLYERVGNPIKGGVGDGFTKYDKKEMELGIKIEREHSPSDQIAMDIARDHLKEIPDYYTRLVAMEKSAKS